MTSIILNHNVDSDKSFNEESMSISDRELYDSGIRIPLSPADFREFVVQRVINAAEAAELLECSRQNISDLVKRNKLRPIKESEKTLYFLKVKYKKENGSDTKQ